MQLTTDIRTLKNQNAEQEGRITWQKAEIESLQSVAVLLSAQNAPIVDVLRVLHVQAWDFKEDANPKWFGSMECDSVGLWLSGFPMVDINA